MRSNFSFRNHVPNVENAARRHDPVASRERGRGQIKYLHMPCNLTANGYQPLNITGFSKTALGSLIRRVKARGGLGNSRMLDTLYLNKEGGGKASGVETH